MSLTILEVLMNAQINLVINRSSPLAFEVGKEQLANAITLLEEGFTAYNDFDESWAKFKGNPAAGPADLDELNAAVARGEA